MLSHHQKIWDIALKKQNRSHTHSHTHPLWLNNHLPEMSSVPDLLLWLSYGILYLAQVLTEVGPKAFQALKKEFSLPNHLLFRYLQLRYVVRTQAASAAITLDSPPVLIIIFGADPTKLISNLYYTL